MAFSSWASRLFPAASVLAAATYSYSNRQSSSLSPVFAVPASADAAPAGALNPKEFVPFKLIEKEQLTHNTYLYRFELPDNKPAGMGVASCLVVRAFLKDKPEDEKAKPVIRPYTPTSPKDARGYMDLIIKVYPNGKIGNYVNNLQIGETLDIKGPIPKIPYKPNMKKHIAMIAGGSGITPMIQVIDEILSNPEDKTEISLMYGNMTQEDIILKDKIDALVEKHKGRFKVYYFISQGKWTGSMPNGAQQGVLRGAGVISKKSIAQFIPKPSSDVMVFVCGPPGMMAAISGTKAPDFTQGEVAGALKELGYTKDMVFKF